MQKFSLAFGFLTRNSTLARFYIQDFTINTEISVKEIKVRYAKFITLLTIPKRLLLMLIKIAWKNSKCESYVWIFSSKFR